MSLATYVSINCIATLLLGSLNTLFHDIAETGISSIYPFLVWPAIHDLAEGGLWELVGILPEVLPTSSREVADHFAAFGVEGVNGRLGSVLHIEVPNMVGIVVGLVG